MTKSIFSPYLVDFRDHQGHSSIACAVCYLPAIAWDTKAGLVFHPDTENDDGPPTPPCDLRSAW